jgi:hypothetical protein
MRKLLENTNNEKCNEPKRRREDRGEIPERRPCVGAAQELIERIAAPGEEREREQITAQKPC